MNDNDRPRPVNENDTELHEQAHAHGEQARAEMRKATHERITLDTSSLTDGTLRAIMQMATQAHYVYSTAGHGNVAAYHASIAAGASAILNAREIEGWAVDHELENGE